MFGANAQCRREEQKEKEVQHTEWNEAEHNKLTKDTAQWCQNEVEFQQRTLEFQQQQVAKQNEAAAKLTTAVMEQTEVLGSLLQLQRDSQHSSVGANTCCLESPEQRSPTPHHCSSCIWGGRIRIACCSRPKSHCKRLFKYL